MLWYTDDLLILKLSYSAHHFPHESEHKAVGYSPPSCLALFTANQSSSTSSNNTVGIQLRSSVTDLLPQSTLCCLSIHADRQGVDISATVCVCVCVCLFFGVLFVRLRISPPRIKLAASNFARRFVGVQDRESHIFVNFAPPEAQNPTNRPARGPRPPGCNHYGRDAPT